MADPTFVTRLQKWSLLLPLCIMLTACDDDPVQIPAPQGDGDIEGVVARQKTGVGVADMVVGLRTDGGQVVAATFTEAGGAFAFSAVADGSYEVFLANLEGAGIDPRFDALEPEVATVTVGDDPPSTLVFAVVGLVPARIAGDVSCAGVAQPDASVRVVGGVIDQTVTSNAQGRFAALDLLAGKYAVFASAPGCVLSDAIRVAEVLRGQFVEMDFSGGGP